MIKNSNVQKIKGSKVLVRAHRLASLPMESIKGLILSFCSRGDLRVLGAGEAICRARKETQKARVIHRKIERLRRELIKQ